ncbi:MAG: hypothetical protein WB808_12065 [Candidatus Dormiibacterota bacterium]
MTEMLSPRRDEVVAPRIRLRALRRRRRLDVRSLVTGMALFLAVAWTIVFGVGIVVR